MQTVLPNFFIPGVLIGTSDSYHFIPLSLTLILPRGNKVSTKQNLLASFFSHTFYLINSTEHPETAFEQNVLKQGE